MFRFSVMVAATMLVTIQPSFAFWTYECSVSATASSICSIDENECPFETKNFEALDAPARLLMVTLDRDSETGLDVFTKEMREDGSGYSWPEKLKKTDGINYYYLDMIGKKAQATTNVSNLIKRIQDNYYREKAVFFIPWVLLREDGSVFATQLKCQALHQ